MQTAWKHAWSEAGEGRRGSIRFGMQMQHRRLSGAAVLADLILGFVPITIGIAFACGPLTILENLIRPLADLLVRTDTNHGFLLPLWPIGGNARRRYGTCGTFLGGAGQPITSACDCRGNLT